MSGLWWYLAGLFTPLVVCLVLFMAAAFFGQGQVEVYAKTDDRVRRKRWGR